MVCLESRIVHAGNTSLVAHIHMSTQKYVVLEGFITFIHVDKDGKPIKHCITIEPSTEAEQELKKRATQLKRMP